MQRAKVKAHSNIALVKYWGKKDEDLIIPFNSSISLTLDKFYTITEVSRIFSDQDEFYLNGKLQDDKETEKISEFVDRFRRLSKDYARVRIESENFFPTAAGLASSASGFAALAGALNEVFQLKLDKKDLSMMARLGSGSATRSIYGGLVEWEKGHDHNSSFARKIDDASWDIGMLAVVLNDKKKKVLSRAGMAQTVKTCPYYPAWVESAESDVLEMKKAIAERNLLRIGEIAESSALKMHATMMATSPSIIYMQEESLQVIRIVKELREEGVLCYFTMDAGPNVKIITNSKHKDKIVEKLSEFIDKDKLIYSTVGPDLEVLEVE